MSSLKLVKRGKAFNIFILICCLFVTGQILLVFIPNEVNMSLNNFTTTEDGIRICYDEYEPKNYNPIKNGIIVGHGIMVNKEVMKYISLELARSGFVVISIDFRGHGKSGGDFNFIAESLDNESSASNLHNLFANGGFEKDIDAAKLILQNRGDINMTNLGYLGYSMGGGIGFQKLSRDNDFHSMVALCPTPEYNLVNTTNPPNLCVIASKFDEAISIDELLLVMQNKTGVSKETIYNSILSNSSWEYQSGNFNKGTASKIFYNKYQDHFLAPYDLKTLQEAKSWFLRSLTENVNAPPNLITPIIMILIAIDLINGIIIFTYIAKFLVEHVSDKKEKYPLNEENLEEKSIKKRLLESLSIILILSFPLMITILPLYLAPLVLTAFMLMLMWGPAMALIIYITKKFSNPKLKLKEFLKKISNNTSIKNFIIGILLGYFFYLFVHFTLGKVFGIYPSRDDLYWIPLYYIITILIYIGFTSYFQLIFQEKYTKTYGDNTKTYIKFGLFNLGSNLLISLFILLTPSLILNFYFIMMFFVPVALLHLGVVVVATYLYKHNKDIIMISAVVAFLPTMMFCSLSPIINIFLFF